MSAAPPFHPEPSLLEGTAHAACRACVIVPARNEEAALPETLNALAGQVDRFGNALPHESFEILLLLNNCTDASGDVARAWKASHPRVRLHILERTLPPQRAHVGTARRLLMDTAWHRLRASQVPGVGILSTDSDTVVATDWVARNLQAIAEGADAVGGVIQLKPGEFEALPAGAQEAYRNDRRYQRLIAELEDLLDPQPGDPWPRHLEHFGASLACTPEIYARAGGMPAVKPLEDVAFVDALRRCEARLRHDPAVVVYTSSRMDGRAEIGLSHQLREWQRMSERGMPHQVPSAAWLTHRFLSLKRLRDLHRDFDASLLEEFPPHWRQIISDAVERAECVNDLLCAIDCDRLIEETFRGASEGPIRSVNRNLAAAVSRARTTCASAPAAAPDALRVAVQFRITL